MKLTRPTIFLAGTLFFAVSISLALAADTASSSAEPIDLTSYYTASVSVLTNYATFPAWKSAAVGHQVFHGVPFQIGGLIYLRAAPTNTPAPAPEPVTDIPVNRTFPALYLCHGSYYKTPDDTPVYNVIFRYDNGSSLTNTLCFGDDILDWKVSPREAPLKTPSGTNSSLAWMGGVFSPKEQTPLRYCMTELDNPHPDQAVTSVDLIRYQCRTLPFILGMTTGPSGLAK